MENSGYLDFALFYDMLTRNVDYKKQCSFICECADRFCTTKPKIALDAGCGTGSLAFKMAKCFDDVIGADPSEEMLEIAQKRQIESSQGNVLFLNQSMENLDLYGTVDLAVSTLDTVNHITNIKKLEMGFSKVSLFLVKGGLFIFDTNTLYKHKEILGNNSFVYDEKDVYCVWQNFFNENSKITTAQLDFFKKTGSRLSFKYERYLDTVKERFYSHRQIQRILKNNGFKLIDCYDDYEFKNITQTTQRITYVTAKI